MEMDGSKVTWWMTNHRAVDASQESFTRCRKAVEQSRTRSFRRHEAARLAGSRGYISISIKPHIASDSAMCVSASNTPGMIFSLKSVQTVQIVRRKSHASQSASVL